MPKSKPFTHNPYKDTRRGPWRPVFAKASYRKRAYVLYYSSLKTYKEIAVIFNTTPVTVKNLFKKMYWPARDMSTCQTLTRYSPKQIRRYRTEYESGTSFATIGKTYNITPHFVSRIAKKQGWFIPRSKWNSTFFIGDNNGGRKAKLARLNSGYSRTESFDGFRATVSYLSKVILREYKFLIGKGTKGQHLDHIYSVWEAFYNPLCKKRPCTIFELCHPVNLQWLNAAANMAKSKWSGSTLKQLRRNIREFNLKYGDPFEEEPFCSMLFDRLNPHSDLLYREEKLKVFA